LFVDGHAAEGPLAHAERDLGSASHRQPHRRQGIVLALLRGNGNGSEIRRGEFDVPVRIELEHDDYEGTTNFWSEVLCEAQWFCFQEKRDVWITFFDEFDEIPEGFTAGPEAETAHQWRGKTFHLYNWVKRIL
jgi:hypothetical protein